MILRSGYCYTMKPYWIIQNFDVTRRNLVSTGVSTGLELEKASIISFRYRDTRNIAIHIARFFFSSRAFYCFLYFDILSFSSWNYKFIIDARARTFGWI